MSVSRHCVDRSGHLLCRKALAARFLGILLLCTAIPGNAQEAAARVATLNQALRSESSPSAILGLLRKRRNEIEHLIRTSPGSVRSVALDEAEVDRLVSVSPEANVLVERSGEWSGPLELLAEDDFEHHRSITHWRLHTTDGVRELFFARAKPVIRSTCQPVLTVSGVATRAMIAVDAVVAQAPTPPVCSTKGVQNIAVVLLTMPSARTFPAGFDAAFFQQLFFGNSGYTLNSYWHESSYGQTSATGQVFGPFALPANYDCTQNDALAAAAIQAASSVDFSQFDRVALIFPVQNCSYGGLGTIGCWETLVPNQNISVAWLPIFPFQQTSNYVGAVAHELGHNLGLNHSDTVDFGSAPVGAFDDLGSDIEYGDPFSVMGQVWTMDGPQKILGQYDAPHKSVELGWLDLNSGGYEEVVSSGSFTLLPFESSRGLRALRVLRNPAIGGWLWLEYRQPIGEVDSTFSFLTNLNEPLTIFDGALVHLENPGFDPLHTNLVDFNAVTQPNDFYNAPLTAGESWSDPYSPLTVSISTANAQGLSATVTYDSSCATLALSGSPIPAGGGNGSISVTAPSSCSWTATTSTPWITLNGTKSGHGNGTVNFAVSASPGGTLQRNGYIAIQRQSLQVIQVGTGPAVVSASPAFGTGNSVRLVLSFRDPRGSANISSANVDISSLASPKIDACSLFIDRASGSISLLNDSGTQYLAPLRLAQTGTSVSNGQCTVSATGSSISGSGNNLQIALQLSFNAAFMGAHSVVATVSDPSTGSSDPIQVGTWVVPPGSGGSASVLLAPSSLNFGHRALGSPSLPSPITVSNSGSALLHIASISISGSADYVESNDCGSTLAAGASCTVQVTFTPSTASISNASLLIADDATGSPQAVSLIGSGGNIPLASVNPTNLVFAGQEIGTQSPASQVTFSNPGADVLTITGISLAGNNAGDFRQTNNCGASLSPGNSCQISVVFSPTQPGSRLGTLSITDNANDSPQSISLSGTASDFVIGSMDGNPTATISAGQTATYHLQISPQNGFQGDVSVACSDPVPLSACTASPSSHLRVTTGTVDFTLQVSTTGATPVAGGATSTPPSSSLFPLQLAAGMLVCIICIPLQRRRLAYSAAVLALAFSFSSCGGGGSSSSGGTTPAPRVTPTGTYQITVNASFGGVVHPYDVTLKVQ